MKYHIEFDIDFRRNPYKGLYIVVEGIDGSGKTTQVDKLVAYFKKQGEEVVKTHEPRKKEGIIGRIIHQVLEGKIQIPAISLQYLFSADRAINFEEVIIPSLKAGKVVISDRCFWSAVPYGILDRSGREYNFKEAEVIFAAQSILSMYHQFIVPDVTIYLDIGVSSAIRRLSLMHKQKEVYEKKEKLEKIVAGYKWLIEQFPKEITVVDGERSVEEVTKQILQIVNRK